MKKVSANEFVGFDLGHGESALGRAFGATTREPEILEYRGERSFVTAIAKTSEGIKIGADAVNLSFMAGAPKVWVKFKDREMSGADVETPTRLFTQTLIEGLSQDGIIRGPSRAALLSVAPLDGRMTIKRPIKNSLKARALKRCALSPKAARP